MDFCNFIKPTEAERLMRKTVVADVEKVVADLWPNAKINVYGSFENGICLPTSDIDITVTLAKSGPSVIPHALKKLVKRLRHTGMTRRIKLIDKAKIPIIKFCEKVSGQEVDISINTANSAPTTQVVKDCIQAYEHFSNLAFVLKCFLQLRGMNEVYLGGLGSYGLALMLLSHLQMHPLSNPAAKIPAPLGILLVDFFKLYGQLFNYVNTGISVRDGGSYFRKTDIDRTRPYLLSILDPTDLSNDVTRNTYQILNIRKAFGHAYNALTSNKPYDQRKPTLLSRIIHIDDVVLRRREKIGQFYGPRLNSMIDKAELERIPSSSRIFDLADDEPQEELLFIADEDEDNSAAAV